MEIKQKSLRIFEFEITDEMEFYDYVNKNYILLKRYMILLKGLVTRAILEFLDSKDLLFIDTRGVNFDCVSSHTKEIRIEPEIKFVKRDKLIISKPLRSGEEIITEDDIVVFARINSGAIIKTDGNAEIFGIVDGHIEVNGDYLILKNINKGEVIFNSESLDKTIFNGIIKKITFVDGVLDIKEL